MQYFGYNEAIFEGAAKTGIQEFIAEEIPTGKISDGWVLIHHFDDDVDAVIKIGLYEHLRDWPTRPPALAVFYILQCSNGLYRLPNEREEEWLSGTKTVPA